MLPSSPDRDTLGGPVTGGRDPVNALVAGSRDQGLRSGHAQAILPAAAAGRRPAGPKDDPGDGPAILDKALAADAKRARRRSRARGAAGIVLDFLADFVANLFP